MRSGKLAILITIAAAAVHCSGNPPVSEPGQEALNAPSAVVIHAIDHAATPSGTQVILRANYPFTYTSYQPDTRTLIVELPEVRIEGPADEIQVESRQVRDIVVSNEQGLDGTTIAKFEFQDVMTVQHSIHLEGNDLIIDFPTLGGTDNAPESPMVAEGGEGVEGMEGAEGMAGMEAPAGVASLEASFPAGMMGPENAAPEAQVMTDGEPEAVLAPIESPPSAPIAPVPQPQPSAAPARLQVKRGAAPAGPPARTLLSIETRGEGPGTAVLLTADGGLHHQHFELQNPPRIVIDLEGVVDRTSRKSISVTSPLLTKVRVAQFASRPSPVARVVLDMTRPTPYAIVPTERGLVVDFSEQAVMTAASAPAQQVAGPLTAEAPPAGAVPMTRPETPQGDPELAEHESAEAGPTGPEPDEPGPAEGPTPDAAHQVPAALPALEPPSVTDRAAEEVPFRPASQGSTGVMISQGKGRFSARSISDTGPKYTGKRISLNFKDADLKDVFRLFHEITGYNIVLDPAVSGTLTIVLENVPDDQALDIILKNNGLDKVFENNVIRIASTQKLAAEAAARKALLEAQELEEEPITFTRSLSYAKSKNVVPIIKKIMSKRGDVIMDDRTNTLIITDLRDRQESINRLIDTLDEQTAQVVIEARIVETDREFERDFGITWGVHGEASAARGTQTRLQFPHQGTVDYDVNLSAPASAGRLGISFGNVLDSVTLDATLDAFELNGDVKVLSSPRIATQNNQKAVIEQGIQIPVVSTTATQINVEFISASLKLEVTPQITREGTVIMDVKVDNSSPDFVNRVAEVPPIITERAETQILVADGGTAVIGGIFKLNDSVTQVSVPGLGKIPGIGWLFRNKSINRKNTELLIFITPRISKKAEPQEDRT